MKIFIILISFLIFSLTSYSQDVPVNCTEEVGNLYLTARTLNRQIEHLTKENISLKEELNKLKEVK